MVTSKISCPYYFIYRMTNMSEYSFHTLVYCQQFQMYQQVALGIET